MKCTILPSVIKGITLQLYLKYKELSKREILAQEMKKEEKKEIETYLDYNLGD